MGLLQHAVLPVALAFALGLAIAPHLPHPERKPTSKPPDLPAALVALHAAFPSSQLSIDAATLSEFGTSAGTFNPPTPASIVVHAESTADVVKVVRIATTYHIVLIPVGGRTSLEGQFLPPTCCDGPAQDNPPEAHRIRPTIHLSLARMDKIYQVYPTDFQAVVGPGVGWQSLNEALVERKLMFPVDPGPGAHFGGMVGVGGSGTNTVGYGTMRGEWILGMEVVLMNGEVIRTRGSSRARKSSTGWDIGRLLMGSEGTLGIITELTVRLTPVLPLKVALTSFPTVSHAVTAVVSILSAGLSPTSLELLDGTSIRGLNLSQILPEPLDERPTVLMRFSSPLESVLRSSLDRVREIVAVNEGAELRVAKDEAENELLWKARKNQFWSQQLLIGEGCRTLITDVCVPISRLAEFVDRSEVDVAKSGLLAPIVAHIGDGNVHRAILYKPKPGTTTAPPEVAALASSLSTLAIELEGTCAGEHGIGSTKRQYLERELGAGTLDVMRRIKEELDPLGLLNPGKILFERK